MKSAAIAALALCSTIAWAGDGARCGSRLSDARSFLALVHMPTQWRETTMDDGKPLVLSLSEQEGQLTLRFTKTGEGLWAEGPAAICRNGVDVEASLPPEQLQLGPAAGWLLRQSMRGGATFRLRRLEGGRLAVSTTGWSGEFVPVGTR